MYSQQLPNGYLEIKYETVILCLVVVYAQAQLDLECLPSPVCTDSEIDDEAAFDATAEFPSRMFDRAISANETLGNVLKAYSIETISQFTELQTNWFNVCPVYFYTINRWAFSTRQYGRCYAISPIHVSSCSTRYCRYVFVNPFQQYYRCFNYYKKVYFWAFCPDSATSYFIYTFRFVPGGCNCRRYLCPELPSK